MKDQYSKEEVIEIKNGYCKVIAEDLSEFLRLEEENRKLKEENETLKNRIEELEGELFNIYLLGYNPEDE